MKRRKETGHGRRATPTLASTRDISSSILRFSLSLSLSLVRSTRCNVTCTQLPIATRVHHDLTVAGTADTSIYGDIDNHTDLTAPILGTIDLGDRSNLVPRREEKREKIRLRPSR